jgi:hypothetical protein
VSSGPTLEVVSEVSERLSYALLSEEMRCAFLSQVMHAYSQRDVSRRKESDRGGVHMLHREDADGEGDRGDRVEDSIYDGSEIGSLLKNVFNSLISHHALGITVDKTYIHMSAKFHTYENMERDIYTTIFT